MQLEHKLEIRNKPRISKIRYVLKNPNKKTTKTIRTPLWKLVTTELQKIYILFERLRTSDFCSSEVLFPVAEVELVNNI